MVVGGRCNGEAHGHLVLHFPPAPPFSQEYYDSWDKYDPDAVLEEMDEEERAEHEAQKAAAEAAAAANAKRTEERRKQLSALRLKVDPASMTPQALLYNALREKQK